MAIMITSIHYVILALFVCCYCTKMFCAPGSLLYILPTDNNFTAENVGCPKNDCCTLNEWIEDVEIFMNKTANQTVVLLPGLHIVNTTRNETFIRDIASIIFTCSNGKAIVRCINRFMFNFLNVEEIQISNIVFNFCNSMSQTYYAVTMAFLGGRNIEVANITIEHGGIEIGHLEQCKNNTVATIHLYNLNITSNNTGIEYYRSQECDPNCTFTTILIMQNCTLNMANINIFAYCTHVIVQYLTIKQIRRPFNRYYSAISIYMAANISLSDIKIEDNITPSTLLLIHIGRNQNIELKGHILFNGNKNSSKLAELGGYQHVKIFPHSKIEFYHNSGISKSLLEFNHRVWPADTGRRVYMEGYQTSLLFKNNELHYGGKVMVFETWRPDFLRCVFYNTQLTFENNKILHNGEYEFYHLKNDIMAALLFVNSKAAFVNTSMVFVNNSVPAGGTFVMWNTEILVYGYFYARFENNKGSDGGAMTLYKQSYIAKDRSQRYYLKGIHKIHFIFNNNLAYQRGGAIFVEDLDYSERTDNKYYTEPVMGLLDLYNNTAKVSGDEIYGGWIDCININNNNNIIIYAKFNITINDHYAVSSNPLQVCMCTNRSSPQCTTEKMFGIFPGQAFQIEAITVGQRFGIVPGVVTAQILDSNGHLEQGQEVQSVGRECTTLYYTVYSTQKFESMKLTVGDLLTRRRNTIFFHCLPEEYHVLLQDFVIKLNLKECLLGYVFDAERGTCLCSQKINTHNGAFCDFSSYQITKTKQLWLSVSNEHTVDDHGVIIHDFCPYNYCKQLADNETLSFHLESPDDQCAFNRSGVLCGACQKNLSQVFGTSRCRKCSNIMIFILLPAFLIAGVLLVGFLMSLNLTVSTGTINGLIFYANIIRVNEHIFFPLEEQADLFLSTFIAWLNLDLGIETCVYDGLDAYAKTWLQLVFPLYIWLIVIIIIVSSHYSTIVSRMTGNNSVSVLATLFLLSYTKILRLVTIIFSTTTLEYPDGFIKRVWLYDGNLEFLKGKHAGLFIASLLLLVLLSVPYTLSLISIQWLQRFSHFRLLSWVHRLMPLFDAYTGPYKHKHRYWTGLLLLIRVLFVVIFTQNTTNNPAVNLLTITVIFIFIFGYFCYMQIYKNFLNTILEMISLLNIGLLSVASSYQLLNNQNSMLTTTISVSIAFIMFTFIVLYHASMKLASMKICKDMKVHLTTAIAKVKKDRRMEEIEEQQPQGQEMAGIVTHSSIELHEPLLEGQ